MASPLSSKAASTPPTVQGKGMIDGFGRRLTYVRMSVTDRCDLRCRYCMPRNMKFVPRADLLTLAEIAELADVFIGQGVKRIRLTGGEPFARSGIEQLCRELGRRLGAGLEELTLTTNGTRLARFAADLRASGIKRINVSLDSRDRERFRSITRQGILSQVLDGIAAAKEAGLKIKINMVALKGINEDEFVPMLHWCVAQGHDLTLIETMPLGNVEEDRTVQYLPLSTVRGKLEQEFILRASPARTGGPARYYEIEGSAILLGLITPLTQNFCEGCNRFRVTATGTAYGCLGHEQRVELGDALRRGGRPAVEDALETLVRGKPQGHDFRIEASRTELARHMNVTGG